MKIIKAIASGIWAAILAAHKPYTKALADQADSIRFHKRARVEIEQLAARIGSKR